MSNAGRGAKLPFDCELPVAQLSAIVRLQIYTLNEYSYKLERDSQVFTVS
jgi:hypothetical protein